MQVSTALNTANWRIKFRGTFTEVGNMTLTIIACIVFIAHVAVWLGIPANRATESAPADMVLETA